MNRLETGRELDGFRCLLADDDADFVDLVGELLLRLGAASVTTASSGVEVLEALSGVGDFDLIVTDHRMPAPTGAQLLAMARTAGYDRPFLIVTAYPDDRFIDSVNSLDRASVLSKPFAPSDLARATRELLAQ